MGTWPGETEFSADSHADSLYDVALWLLPLVYYE